MRQLARAIVREKMKIIGREKELERINRQALRIAKMVARETGALFAGIFVTRASTIPPIQQRTCQRAACSTNKLAGRFLRESTSLLPKLSVSLLRRSWPHNVAYGEKLYGG